MAKEAETEAKPRRRWSRQWDACQGHGGTDRFHHAQGYCQPCYKRVFGWNSPNTVYGSDRGWSRYYGFCRACKTEEVPHHAHGFCVRCYNVLFRTGELEAYKNGGP